MEEGAAWSYWQRSSECQLIHLHRAYKPATKVKRPPTDVCLRKKRKERKREKKLGFLHPRCVSDQSPLVLFAPPTPYLVPPRGNESLPCYVVGACYKAKSPAVPFRSELSDRCAHQLSDNQDLTVLTTMTLLCSPGLTVK